MVSAVPQRAEIVADVGGLRRKLRVGIGEIEEIEAATGMAIWPCWYSLASKALTVKHIRAVLAIALKGGGLKGGVNEALADEVNPLDIQPGSILSLQIILAGLIDLALNPEDVDALGKSAAGGGAEKSIQDPASRAG